jgi:hypothetical protein
LPVEHAASFLLIGSPDEVDVGDQPQFRAVGVTGI